MAQNRFYLDVGLSRLAVFESASIVSMVVFLIWYRLRLPSCIVTASSIPILIHFLMVVAFNLSRSAASLGVGKTINSPLLTHKSARKLSLIRICVRCFPDAYSRPNSKLTHNFAQKYLSTSSTHFFQKIVCLPVFRRTIASKWQSYDSSCK